MLIKKKNKEVNTICDWLMFLFAGSIIIGAIVLNLTKKKNKSTWFESLITKIICGAIAWYLLYKLNWLC